MYKDLWGSIATNLRGAVRAERWSWHVSIDRCQFGEANHGLSETTALRLAGPLALDSDLRHSAKVLINNTICGAFMQEL
ncbi:hypothetical protein [Paraburkholderia terrae]|uniref:hypothetical protein n=1 Tax=Paraburkholderia terrae TaxID=311230 RepID=UPI0012E06705|nr:hypothetical protein [Paraburkholderia terrae]